MSLLILLSWAGCSIDERAFLPADFLDKAFGQAEVDVLALDEPELTRLMNEVHVKYRLYRELRDWLDLGVIMLDQCVSVSDGADAETVFSVDIACVYQESSSAMGSVDIVERVAASGLVTEIVLTYHDVHLDDFSVSGTEHILETDGATGSSVRRLELVHRGLALNYEFRLGFVDSETLVFDYTLESEQGTLLARLIPSAVAGQLADVSLTGVDAQLLCELRAIPWELGDLARGSCDNGVAFGLPVPVLTP